MQLEIGAILDGKITGLAPFGAFVELEDGTTGMVHISEVASSYVNDISEHLKEGQSVKVKVLAIEDNGKVALSFKKASAPVKRAPKAPAPPVTSPGDYQWQPRKAETGSFEEMMARFKQDSEEKLSDLKRITDDRRGNHRK